MLKSTLRWHRQILVTRRTYSTSSSFDTLDLRPVQRPDTAAYFMAKPKYSDLLSSLTLMTQSHPLPRYNKADYKRGKWLGREAMEMKLGIKINANEYKQLVDRLCQADNLRVGDFKERENAQVYLSQFKKASQTSIKKQGDGDKEKGSWKKGHQDKLGRWRAAGKRKEAIAVAWVVPVEQAEEIETGSKVEEKATEEPAEESTEDIAEEEIAAERLARNEPPAPDILRELGEVIVNSKPLPEYFIRSTDRESVIFPMQVAQCVGRYHVFLRVRGGGHSGQAEACQQAVSRALVAADRKRNGAIRAAGLLVTDGRRVERKKTGKPKARKSYTWVKR